VPYGQSVYLYGELARNNVTVRGVKVFDAKHGGDSADYSPWETANVQFEAFDFIEKQLPLTAAESTKPTAIVANCDAFSVAGSAYDESGTTWTYHSTDSREEYDMSGKLYFPPTLPPGLLRAVILNHDQAVDPATEYWDVIAPRFTAKGMIVIAPRYSHASGDSGKPSGPAGASDENMLRAHKARALLSCLGNSPSSPSGLRKVDMTKLAMHGHGLGGSLTVHMVGNYPADFAVASHTGSGVAQGYVAEPGATIHYAEEKYVQRIRIPYAQYYADQDQPFPPPQTIYLDRQLGTKNGATKRAIKRFSYPDEKELDHATIATEPHVFDDATVGINVWYKRWGVMR